MHISRAAMLRAAALTALSSAPLGLAPRRTLAEEKMKTSESFGSFEELTGVQFQALGAGAVSSRSRPDTGVILLDEVQATGSANSPTITADLVLDGGVAASCSFDSVWPLSRGMYYDVETRSKQNDAAFLQVARSPSVSSLSGLPDKFFTGAIFQAQGRFGAYGAPTDVRVLSSSSSDKSRSLELSFRALSPNGADVPRHALVTALQPEGSRDVVMLVGETSAARWKTSEPAVRSIAGTLRLSTRKTSLERKRENDYRFEAQGGLKGAARDGNLDF